MAYLANYLKTPTKDVLVSCYKWKLLEELSQFGPDFSKTIRTKARGRNEESPLFTAPESVKIYDSKLDAMMEVISIFLHLYKCRRFN